ncbi:hypothetical protein C8R43DRAFT_947992 [Mycena crocata]|nr:hypothetical protein C8R43DRAFT_947992 [Mycena crocata]
MTSGIKEWLFDHLALVWVERVTELPEMILRVNTRAIMRIMRWWWLMCKKQAWELWSNWLDGGSNKVEVQGRFEARLVGIGADGHSYGMMVRNYPVDQKKERVPFWSEVWSSLRRGKIYDAIGGQSPGNHRIAAGVSSHGGKISRFGVRDLQWSISELQAYILWYDRMQYKEFATPQIKTGLRGSEFLSDTDLQSRLTPLMKIDMEDMEVETRVWAQAGVTPALLDTRMGKLQHNFEAAARGYSNRLDGYNQDQYTMADIQKMVENTVGSGKNHNISATLAGLGSSSGSAAGDLMEKYGEQIRDIFLICGSTAAQLQTERFYLFRTPMSLSTGTSALAPSSKWYRQHTDMKRSFKKCVWALKLIVAWEMGFLNTGYPMVHNIELIPRCKDLLLFVAPPPHLFMNAVGDKVDQMLFIWTCICRSWLGWMDRDIKCQQAISWGLTTQKWREVLGGIHWKWSHPPGLMFDVQRFWKHCGLLIFGSEDNVD